MKYTIRELEKQFRDFESSELIAQLVQAGYVDEATEREIEVAIDLLEGDEEYFDSSGYSWAKQQAEAREKGVKVYSVSDVQHTWSMGLITDL